MIPWLRKNAILGGSNWISINELLMMNERTTFSLNPKYLCNLFNVLSWLLAFLNGEETCWLPSMLRVYWLFVSKFHFTIIVRNFSAFSNMLFSLNQSVAISLSLFIVLNSFSKVHSCDEIELSSATLCSSDSLTR